MISIGEPSQAFVRGVTEQAGRACIESVAALLGQPVEGWFAWDGLQKHKLESARLWFRRDGDRMLMNGAADGTEPDAARAWMSGIVRGIGKAATNAGVSFDEQAFEIAGNGLAATLTGTIPIPVPEP